MFIFYDSCCISDSWIPMPFMAVRTDFKQSGDSCGLVLPDLEMTYFSWLLDSGPDKWQWRSFSGLPRRRSTLHLGGRDLANPRFLSDKEAIKFLQVLTRKRGSLRSLLLYKYSRLNSKLQSPNQKLLWRTRKSFLRKRRREKRKG